MPLVGSRVLVVSLCVVAATLSGLVAATAHPVLIGLAIGSLVSIVFVSSPSLAIWFIVAGGLIFVGLVPIWAEPLAGKAGWGISLAAFVLLGGALFRVATNLSVQRATPSFVWLALVFMIYVGVVGVFRSDDAFEFLSGFKRYFQAYGLLFGLAWLAIGKRSIAMYRKFFLLVALIQLPWALYELVALVPIREGMKAFYPMLVPIDVVAGTFGASLSTGGANGEMALFLIIVLAFLAARFRLGVVRPVVALCLAPVLVAPLLMGETKIVLVLLPMMALAVYGKEVLRRPAVAVAGVLVFGVFTAAAGYAYVQSSKAGSFQRLVDETLGYNVYERGHGSYFLNRRKALWFWAEQQGLRDPISFVFGEGVGATHERTGGHIARRYPGYGVGMTTAAALLWEQGVIGSMLFVSVLMLAWREAGRLRAATSDALVRADAAAIQAAMPLFAVFLLYRVSMIEALPIQVVLAALLGYLAWLVRQEPTREKPQQRAR